MYDSIILDVAEEFKKFRKLTTPYVEDFDDFARETIDSILEYVMEASSGEDALQEFADHVEEQCMETMTEEASKIVRDATLELGQVILKQLLDGKAYDHHGHLCYKLGTLAGPDIVLVPLSPDELDDNPDSEF